MLYMFRTEKSKLPIAYASPSDGYFEPGHVSLLDIIYPLYFEAIEDAGLNTRFSTKVGRILVGSLL
jgi:hypothetical protein